MGEGYGPGWNAGGEQSGRYDEWRGGVNQQLIYIQQKMAELAQAQEGQRSEQLASQAWQQRIMGIVLFISFLSPFVFGLVLWWVTRGKGG